MEEKKYLTTKEKIGFPIAAFGRSGIYTVTTMFYMIFIIDVAKIDTLAAGSIVLFTRIFDAVIDPIIGVFVDKTNTKWGKIRPYLLFTPIPVCISTILLFCAPFSGDNGNTTAALIYAVASYIFWSFCFSMQDVPFWSLSSVITPNEAERTAFISNGRLGSTFGGILPALLVPTLRTELGITKGYLTAGIIFGVLGAVLSSLAFFTTKERIPSNEKNPTLGETISVLRQNKVLIIVIFCALLGSTMTIANQSADYIANYLVIQGYTDFDILKSTNDIVKAYSFWIPRGTILTTLTVAIGIGMVPAMVVFPMLRKKFDLKQIYIGSSIFGAIAHIACYCVFASNPSKVNLYVLWVMLVFMGFPLGIYNVITYAIIADSVDYVEWKTGKRNEGVCFSFQTFLSQIAAGIAGVATSWALKMGEYKEPIDGNLDINGKQILEWQEPKTQLWLLIMVTLIPAAGFLLTIIPMLFNDYTGKVKKQAQKELLERREKAIAESEAD